MLDDVLLRAIRRFWSETEVSAAYERIFAAYSARVDSVVVITNKSTDGDTAAGQIVVHKDDYRDWMAALEQRLEEFSAQASGAGTTFTGTEHVEFCHRTTST